MPIGHEDGGDEPIVGRFHVGWHKEGRPVAASSWRVTTRVPFVADALVTHFVSPSVAGEVSGGGVTEVLTGCNRVPVILAGQRAVTFRMVLQGAGEIFHSCDGYRFLEPMSESGDLCGCPSTLKERKAEALAGRGPVPATQIRFRLADLPTIGLFTLNSSSWALAESLPRLRRALSLEGGPVQCMLRYQIVEFTTQSGLEVSYRRPVVELAGITIGIGVSAEASSLRREPRRGAGGRTPRTKRWPRA
ncbi:recombination directionality factor [Streptomyces brasiliensis]|uniref:Uncharacterized protein n=1 Tax=Streptomyces brasiliensis TaxID=1954 RepID=A0A917KWQ4_9ACTN|nr:hypothetical protein GCM10010121_051320 [Streptomyces brasiliensis]